MLRDADREVEMAAIPSYDLPESIKAEYTYLKWVDGIGWCGTHKLLYHWTVHIGIDYSGYADRFCFQTEGMAKASLDDWNGVGDMPGDWHKHPTSGRRRDPATGETWDETEYREGR